MAKHGFRVGGNGKQVVIVPELAGDVGTVPTVNERAAGWPDVRLTPDGTIPEGWSVEGAVDTSVADMGSGGTVIVDGAGAIEVVLTSEPDVIWNAPSLVADDDGMGAMQATEVVTSLTDAALMVVASEPAVSPFAALVAQYRPIVADCVVRVDLPAMLAVDARAMAQRVADMTGVAVNVIGPAGVESIAPKRPAARAASVARGTVVHSGDATTAKEEGTLARCARGEWLDSDVPESNATILTLKHALQTAHEALDLDMLLTLDRKTVSTYYNHARAYRTWAIADVTRQLAERDAARAAAEAALDAEFGFRLAAD